MLLSVGCSVFANVYVSIPLLEILLNLQTSGLYHLNQSHYNSVIMSVMAYQITSLTNVYSTVYSRRRSKKIWKLQSLAFVRGIQRWSVKSPHKGPLTRKMFPFDDVIMLSVATAMACSGHTCNIHAWSVTSVMVIPKKKLATYWNGGKCLSNLHQSRKEVWTWQGITETGRIPSAGIVIPVIKIKWHSNTGNIYIYMCIGPPT